MRTQRLAVTMLAAASIAGCATTANYEAMLKSWDGAPELDLIRKWGPPIQSYEASGRKFIVYSSNRNLFLPGTAPTYTTTFVGNVAYTNRAGGTPAQNIGLVCRTTFEIFNERVVSSRWEGNDCKAMPK